MKIFILLLTLISQNLAGNSSFDAGNSVLGMQFRTQNAESVLDSTKSSLFYLFDSRVFFAKRAAPPPRSPTRQKAAAFSLLGESLAFSASSKKSAGGTSAPFDSDFLHHEAGEFSDASHGFNVDSANCKNGDITGFWLSPRDKVSARTSIIKIFKKDGKYFAYNVAFLDELPPKKDALNQNFALRDREILGSVYAYNLERSGEASYINGRYYDFNKGKIFHLKAKLDCNKLILLISADNVGFLGKKKVYSAITKSEAEFYIKEHPTIDFSGVK